MTLLMITLAAVFLAGAAVGAFTLVVVGIHAQERRMIRTGAVESRTGAASRRLLATGLVRDEARR
ncbi:hypothetical protein [Actinomadura alba]|uniref:Uncharacterized protein n=1 Tax=Actinomadura alba TaxID=406431 RepID=A0ABR7M2D2_9ACTN|nr:hypothetical protein [Actinomadura alba]MBC6470875.1 hypothetical protein [Actinomadura alba]